MKNFKITVVLVLFLNVFMSCHNNESSINIIENTDRYSELDYQKIIKNLRNNIDLVLLTSKPNEITLQEYKIELLRGKLSISNNDKEKIMEFSQELKDYGKFVIESNNLEFVDDDSYIITMGGLFSPSDKLNTKFYDLYNESRVEGSDILRCLVVAVGADALWALGGSSASSWTAAAITRAFSSIAKRFLGPVGAAIAAVSFGICMTEAINE